jgi:hypothetical protein
VLLKGKIGDYLSFKRAYFTMRLTTTIINLNQFDKCDYDFHT